MCICNQYGDKWEIKALHQHGIFLMPFSQTPAMRARKILTSPTRQRGLVRYLARSLKGGSFIGLQAHFSDLGMNHSSDRANSHNFVSEWVPAFFKFLLSRLNCCPQQKGRSLPPLYSHFMKSELNWWPVNILGLAMAEEKIYLKKKDL